VNTPITALKLGAALDFVQVHSAVRVFNNQGGDGDFTGDGTIWDGALYASFQATEKLSLSLRGELVDDANDSIVDASELGKARAKIWSGTATAQYDLWKNVITRVEARWDHGDNGKFFGGNANSSSPNRRNAFLLALRSWEAPPGAQLALEVFRSRYLWHVEVTVHGKEKLVTELGDLPALRIDGRTYKLRRDGSRNAGDAERRFTMWISDDDGRVPLEIKAVTDYGDIRMQITDYQPGSGKRLRP